MFLDDISIGSIGSVGSLGSGIKETRHFPQAKSKEIKVVKRKKQLKDDLNSIEDVYSITQVIEAAHYDSLLFDAAKEGNVALCEECIKNGANPNWRDMLGNTPLQWAAIHGKSKVAKILIQSGARLDNVCKDTKNSIIHSAAKGGSCSILKWLLKAGIEPDCRNHEGETPLHRAVEFRHLKLVQYLLRHRAHVNARDKHGTTPLHLATRLGFPEIAAELLINQADVNSQDGEGNTAMHVASENGRTDIASLLVENLAEVNVQNVEGKTPLHFCSKNGLEEMAALLILRGANQHSIVDKAGKTAFDMGNAVMRHAMIHAGRDKPKISKRQQQALAMAAKIAKEKAKQQEDMIKAQEAQQEAIAEVNRRKNEEYQLRIEAAREKKELRLRHLEEAKKRRDEKRDVVAIARAELAAHKLKLEEDTKRILEEQERKWQEHLERENGVERAKRLIQNQDIILLIKAFFSKNCRIGHMRAAHIAEKLVMNFNVRGLEHLYRMYGTGELDEKREKMEISKEEYALMELEFPWVGELLLRDGEIRVESILSNGVVGKEVLEVHLNKPGQYGSTLRDVPKLEKFHKIEKRKRKFGDKRGTGSQMSTKDDSRSTKTPMGSERTGTGTGSRRKHSFMNNSNSNSGSVYDLNDHRNGSPQQDRTTVVRRLSMKLQMTKEFSQVRRSSLKLSSKEDYEHMRSIAAEALSKVNGNSKDHGKQSNTIRR